MRTGFVGIGSMGSMLVRALLWSRALSVENVWAANRSAGKLTALAEEFRGIHLGSPAELAANCDLIFLCLKAEDIAMVLAQMDSNLHSQQLLVSTCSQVPLDTLEHRVPCRAVKLIPSITQEIGAGVALLMYGSRVTKNDREVIETLLRKVGHPIEIPESLSRPAIGLTSGGPAFVAYLLESMVEEAVHSNPELESETARCMVLEMAFATLQLLAEGKMQPKEVIRRVAVHGGITALGIDVLARHMPKVWQTLFLESAEREKISRRSFTFE